MVTNAVSEMRRYYSRKVIDVLIKVTRSSLDVLRRVFAQDSGIIFVDFASKVQSHFFRLTTDATTTTVPSTRKPMFLLHSTLMIPNISIRPNLDELQEALIAAGKNMTGVSKGVAQWTSGKESVGKFSTYVWKFFFLENESFRTVGTKSSTKSS